MKTPTILYPLAMVISLTGCFALRSNVTPDARLSASRHGFVSRTKYEAVPFLFSRILVVMKARQTSGGYADQLTRAFPAAYQVCTLTLNQLQPAGHAKAIQEQLATCRSDVILIVERTHRGSVLGIDAPASDDFAQFAFELRSVTTGETFWKAVATASPLRGERFPARTLVQRLKRDGLINSNGMAAR